MNIIVLLLIIPLWSISVIVYGATIIDIVWHNNFLLTQFSISLLLSLFLFSLIWYFMRRVLANTLFMKNRPNRFMIYVSYYSFIHLFLLGLALIINSIIYQFNLLNVFLGGTMIGFFLLATIQLIRKKEEIVLTIVSIDDSENAHIKCLTLESEKKHLLEFYVPGNTQYQVGDQVKGIYNKYINEIVKIKEFNHE